eukprot:gnl/MRDRNA2_/MRDRNA2_205118_c0_seq1.p1 gnl/MRDRNA2_/MRDRNA2_205118_c0~~gnl/MRDRNA2_/MRDRNA2_205118_c0_seq1.p1  ORF type:complete len:204 (-),score=22.39 gnl/MRDRNA2_/MRDRNA2_205118_c0_seq1:151-726(-)
MALNKTTEDNAGETQEILRLHRELNYDCPRYVKVVAQIDVEDHTQTLVDIDSDVDEFGVCTPEFFVFDGEEHHYMFEFTLSMVTLYRDGARCCALSFRMSHSLLTRLPLPGNEARLDVGSKDSDDISVLRYISSVRIYLTRVTWQDVYGKKRSLLGDADGGEQSCVPCGTTRSLLMQKCTVMEESSMFTDQ